MQALTARAAQAVLYFRRALKLNRHYLSAWTLMGHEYVEMKNPPAAIGAARRSLASRMPARPGNHHALCPPQCLM